MRLAFSITVILSITTVAYVIAAPGDLDAAFNSTGPLPGTVLTPFTVGRDDGNALALQPDGKIVVAGDIGDGSSFALVRYNGDGSLDNSFNNTGKAVTPIPNASSVSLNALALQADGKILAAGASFVNARQSFTVVRYNANGTLDSGFNGNGIVRTSVGNGSADGDQAHAMVVQQDGKIVVVGYSNNSVNHDFAVVRYNQNGSLDTGFNGTGTLITSFSSQSDDYGTAVQITPGAKIIIGGATYEPQGDFALLRFNSDGSADTTFGTNGKVRTSLSASEDIIWSIALYADGRIIVSGDCNCAGADDFALARYTEAGSLDSSFGTMGFVITPLSTMRDQAFGIALMPNGRIVVAGYSGNDGPNPQFAIVRYNPTGSLDTSFGFGGIAKTSIGTRARAHALALQPDGKIVAAGSAGSGTDGDDFAAARYFNYGIRSQFDYDGDGKSDLSVFRPSVGEWYYQPSTNGVTRGFGFGTSTDKPVPADYTGDGKADIAFFRPSTGDWYVLRSEDSTYFAFPFGANGDIPAPADYDGDGKSDAAVYRPSAQTWFILKSTGGVLSVPFGLSDDIPTPADYDGDGKADVGIYRPSVGQWWNLRSSNGSVFAATFGSPTDKPVAGDYTGDGKADVAFYRPSEGTWYILRSEDFTYYAFPFGNSTDKPAPADFDGDGKYDAAVFRPSDTNWYILRSTGGVTIQQFGLTNDIPLPGAFVP